ncbi:MAG: hypothetical protein JNK04_15015 [Myxococcales bacterium]|nr:hypothetical protein [Myxococcales bacterium]
MKVRLTTIETETVGPSVPSSRPGRKDSARPRKTVELSVSSSASAEGGAHLQANDEPELSKTVASRAAGRPHDFSSECMAGV